MLQEWDGLLVEVPHESHVLGVEGGPVSEVDLVELCAHPTECISIAREVGMVFPSLIKLSELNLDRMAELPQNDKEFFHQCRFHWWLFVSFNSPQEILEEDDGAAVSLAHLVCY